MNLPTSRTRETECSICRATAIERFTQSGISSRQGQYCLRCVNAEKQFESEASNPLKGETAILAVRLRLAQLGFATAIPLPDEGEDLWFSWAASLQHGYRPIFRGAVKSARSRAFRYEHLICYTESAFDRIREQKRLYIFVLLDLSPSNAIRAGEQILVGCFEPTWFVNQSWFRLDLRDKERQTCNYNIRFYVEKNGDILVRSLESDPLVYCTEYFREFSKYLPLFGGAIE